MARNRAFRAEVHEVPLAAILALREAYRREMACQIAHDSWHERGFTRMHLLVAAGRPVGYGAVGGPPREPKDIVKELYLEPAERANAAAWLRALVRATGARRIQAQTNDPLLFPLIAECGNEVVSDTLLFAEGQPTAHQAPGVVFRPLTDADRPHVFPHVHEPVGEWALERAGEIVATGGFTLYYNPPWADLYMEVALPHRGQGLGRYIVQELGRACRAAGRVSAARCHESNAASRAALLAGGMIECGRIVSARLAD